MTDLRTAPADEILRWLLSGRSMSLQEPILATFTEEALLFYGSDSVRCAIERRQYEVLMERFGEGETDGR